jgi:hypothetical protein
VVSDLTARLRKHVTFWFVESQRKCAAAFFEQDLGILARFLPSENSYNSLRSDVFRVHDELPNWKNLFGPNQIPTRDLKDLRDLRRVDGRICGFPMPPDPSHLVFCDNRHQVSSGFEWI